MISCETRDFEKKIFGGSFEGVKISWKNILDVLWKEREKNFDPIFREDLSQFWAADHPQYCLSFSDNRPLFGSIPHKSQLKDEGEKLGQRMSSTRIETRKSWAISRPWKKERQLCELKWIPKWNPRHVFQILTRKRDIFSLTEQPLCEPVCM